MLVFLVVVGSFYGGVYVVVLVVDFVVYWLYYECVVVGLF